MKDLLRSPLQFTQPMTTEEWQELVLRASHRELQREKRRIPKEKTAPATITARRRGPGRLLIQAVLDAATAS